MIRDDTAASAWLVRQPVTRDASPACRSVDATLFRATMGLFATGVTVVTYRLDGEPAGMTANAFMSVSLDPPLVLVSVRERSRFNEWVGAGVRYGVNFLAEDQQALSAHFGGRPQADLDPPFGEHDGTPLLNGSLAQLVARTVDVHPAGDHRLYVAEVEYVRHGAARRPLVFHGGHYRRVHDRTPTFMAGGEEEGG